MRGCVSSSRGRTLLRVASSRHGVRRGAVARSGFREGRVRAHGRRRLRHLVCDRTRLVENKQHGRRSLGPAVQNSPRAGDVRDPGQ